MNTIYTTNISIVYRGIGTHFAILVCLILASVHLWKDTDVETLSLLRRHAERLQALTSFQMTVSDSPVVLEVPTEKINLRSHATSSSLST